MDEHRTFPRGEIFHICNKSIANYHIFRNEKSIVRFLLTVNYYNDSSIKGCLSKAIRQPLTLPDIMSVEPNRFFILLAYCIMPDHYHLLVKIVQNHSFPRYMNTIEGSYSHYYNKLNNRKGPLWQSRFRSSEIKDNFTLLHVHRYIHLNPTTAGYVSKPNDWKWSSYNYFISDPNSFKTHKEISISSKIKYKKFIDNQIDYQKTIKGIRRKLLE